MKSLTIQNILVPIDFSEMSIQAIGVARQLARRFGATIGLAHVHQFDYPADFGTGLPPLPPFSTVIFEQDSEKRIAGRLRALANEHGLSTAGCRLLSGGPAFDEICRFTRDISADLVVMPTHGYTGLKHVFLGSTAERVIRHSPCPVFVVRQGKQTLPAKRMFAARRILVPVDFSDCSLEGLRYAVGFANKFGATIVLLHAAYLGYIYSSEGNSIYDVPALQKAARVSAERRIRELVRRVDFGRAKFGTVITEGSPVLDICAFAKDHKIDLIITSTHGFTGLKHVLIGSVAEQVVRHAPCSVLVVPSHPHVRMVNLAKARARVRRKRVEPSAGHRTASKKCAAIRNCCEARIRLPVMLRA
jgi:nucleotide-binding universal stress UspA family protein